MRFENELANRDQRTFKLFNFLEVGDVEAKFDLLFAKSKHDINDAKEDAQVKEVTFILQKFLSYCYRAFG